MDWFSVPSREWRWEAMAWPKEKAGSWPRRGRGSEKRAQRRSARSGVPSAGSSSAPRKPEHSKLARSHIERGDGRGLQGSGARRVWATGGVWDRASTATAATMRPSLCKCLSHSIRQPILISECSALRAVPTDLINLACVCKFQHFILRPSLVLFSLARSPYNCKAGGCICAQLTGEWPVCEWSGMVFVGSWYGNRAVGVLLQGATLSVMWNELALNCLSVAIPVCIWYAFLRWICLDESV